MSQRGPQQLDTKQKVINLTLAVVAGQVGCLTLVIILLAVFIGLYLDNLYGTKPTFTIGLLLGSIPVSLILMFVVVRAAVKRIKVKPGDQTGNEEVGVGK